MRITVDIRLLAHGDTTGIPGYTRDLVNTLLKNNTQHQYTLLYNALRRQPLLSTWRSNPAVSVSEGRIPNRLLNFSFGAFNLPKLRTLTKADVVFSPNLDILPHTKTPRVITFHDASFIRYPEFFSTKDHLWHQMQHYGRQARQATRIIAVSEFTKADLITQLKLPAEKIDVIYSGINSNCKRLTPAPAPAARPFILYLGSLEPRKNIPLLIQAFNELKTDRNFKEYELVLAGRPGYRYQEIEKLVAHSPVREDIRLLGPVTNSERAVLYNTARVFVFPSWLEGFGFPPLEAQACGTPVIAANRASLPEILGTSALLINPWHSSELTEAIRLIETNSKLRETKIAAGYKNIERFSWHQTAAQTLATLSKAAQA